MSNKVVIVREFVLVAWFAGCASGPAAPAATTGPPQTAASAECPLADQKESTKLCVDADEVVRVDRIAVDGRGGNVLTGARMVFRPAPGRTAQSLQHMIDCQLGESQVGDRQADPQAANCPLAIQGVRAVVQPIAEGFAVEIRPNDGRASHRIAHVIVHQRMALELARFESSECRQIEPKVRAACPFLGPVTAIEDLPEGVRVEFAKSTSADTILARMRCHYSFAQAHGFTPEAAACPLYVPGLRLDRSRHENSIDITTSGAAKVSEVRTHVRQEALYSVEARSP
jgi:hypothetical protein